MGCSVAEGEVQLTYGKTRCAGLSLQEAAHLACLTAAPPRSLQTGSETRLMAIQA